MYNKNSDTEMYAAFGNALELARTFSLWEWAESELPAYGNLIKTLHADITQANQSIIDRYARPVRPFDAGNALKRRTMFTQILSVVTRSKEQRQQAARGRLLRRYQPIFYLGVAIQYYSWGLSRLLDEDFSKKWPYKNGLSNSEGVLLDFYAAKRSLAAHQQFQRDFTGRFEYASAIGKRGKLKAYEKHYLPVKERAVSLIKEISLTFESDKKYSITDLTHQVLAMLHEEFPGNVPILSTVKKWIMLELPRDKLKGPGRPKNKC